MSTYLKNAQRKALAREAAAELMDGGLPFQEVRLKAVAAHLGWSLGTLHRAYSIVSTLLNDMLLEFEDATYHAAYLVGDGGLAAELTLQAHRMHDWLERGSHVQLMRYQMALGCRSEDPLELPLRHSRDSSWEFTRDLLVQISVKADEEYTDLNSIATLLTALSDGLKYQFFSHGDRDRWLADTLRGIDLVVDLAQPRKVAARTSLGDQRWTADQMSARRRAALTEDARQA